MSYSKNLYNKHPTVDVDGHILEPRNTWKDYLEPKFRNRSIELVMEESGEVLLIDGKPLEVVRNRTALLGGIDGDPEILLRGGQKLVYEDGCPAGAYLPEERLKVMDKEGIDISLLYPTIGICWEGKVMDGELAAAYTRAYNRWLVDFCSHDRQRLIPIAHISLLDPELAVKEIKRSARDGCKGIFLSPDLKPRAMRHFDHPDLRQVWATAQDLELPISFHVVVRDERSHNYFDPNGDKAYRFGLFDFSFLAIDVMAAFTEFLSLGVLEEFPRLKVSILESGANWISAWLDRMDHKFEVVRSTTILTKKPSEYFFRQCIVSADPDETLTSAIVGHMGDDYFVWASDYPHVDASYGVLEEIKTNLSGLNQNSQRKVLGDNAVRFYGLN